MDNPSGKISQKPGEKTKSYREFDFSVIIPVVTPFQNEIRIKFSINKSGSAVAMIVNQCKITDILGKTFFSKPNDAYIPAGIGQKQINVSIPFDRQAPMWRDANLQIDLFAQNGKKYEVCYQSDMSRKLSLKYVLWNPMTASDKNSFVDVFHSYVANRQAIKQDPVRSDRVNDDQHIKEVSCTPFTNPVLEKYKNAVLQEMIFLRNSGGRKYKVSNGEYISPVGTMFAYHFELETELRLSDDAPIKIITTGLTADGTVLICEEFHIIVVIDKDLGSKVSSAYISVEPWKLLETLHNKMCFLSQSDKIALKLLVEGPAIASKGSYTQIPQGQEIAKQRALKDDITIIWGPPGTGKTHTMSEIAIEFLKQGKSILIVSHSNISVDGVVNKVSSMLISNGMEDLLQNGKVLRYGYVREETLSKNLFAVSFNYALSRNPSLQKQMEYWQQEKAKLKNSGLQYDRKRVQIEKELKDLRAQLKDEEQLYVQQAQLVATTISKVNIDSVFENKKYDAVMFDEVSMAYVPQLLSAATHAKSHFIAVGDFRQLPPIAQSEARKVLSTDIFSFLKISTPDGTIYNHPWLVMLNEQRRMHPRISLFPNRYVYNRLLKDHESVKVNRCFITDKKPLSGHAMNLVDLSGTYCAASKDSNNSRFNIVSAIISFATALTAEEDNENSIGIITPYAAQTRIIHAMIQDLRRFNQTNVVCSTVHQFQGSERNLIIFDAVESYPSSKPGWLMSKNDNGSVTRLINVAITRARGKLITIANGKFWLKKFENTSHLFYRLVKHLTENENCFTVKEQRLQGYLKILNYGKNIRYFAGFDDCSEILKGDICKAKNQILISIPDGQLVAESAKVILSWVDQAEKCGIRVLVKTNDFQSLPDEWKRISWGTDDAVFPLLLIDESIIWYGIPDAQLMFRDGNCGYITTCKTIFRISGENTVDIIKNLADLEYRTVDHQRTPLLEKTSHERASINKDSDGKESAGLAKYVETYSECPKCQHAMKLMRNRAGKVFLKCSSCDQLEYLTPELTNQYIDENNIICPKCSGNLKAGLSHYGIYVKCDGGHFLKPDEI